MVAPLVVSADPAWPGRYAALAGGMRLRLRPLARRIDHIGSTAIPGMAAKDVIDVQVSVVDLDAAEEAFARPLEQAGFELAPWRVDHVPAGRRGELRGTMGDDPARWAKRLWRRRGHPAGAVNLHVRLVGSPNERLALLFRDWFRAHPAAVAGYSGFKVALAGSTADLDAYSDVKDPVVDVVVVAAEEWAAATGWTP